MKVSIYLGINSSEILPPVYKEKQTKRAIDLGDRDGIDRSGVRGGVFKK